jgi:competence protein ComEA
MFDPVDQCGAGNLACGPAFQRVPPPVRRLQPGLAAPQIGILILLGFVSSAGAQTLPAGKGRDILEGPCSECHGSEEVQGRAWTAERWRAVVGQMVNKGANLSDEETKTLIDYLVANFPPINVNKATAKELQSGLQLTDAEAAAIIRYRTIHGNFKDWNEFTKVPGVNATKLEGIKDSVAF